MLYKKNPNKFDKAVYWVYGLFRWRLRRLVLCRLLGRHTPHVIDSGWMAMSQGMDCYWVCVLFRTACIRKV